MRMKQFKLFRNLSIILLFLFPVLNSLKAQQPGKPDNMTATEPAADSADRNNNFYDNAETYALPLHDLEIAGEIENPGKVDFSKLQKRSVIVKETLLKESGGDAFVGAYRYDGYSLFDILNDRIIKKKNAAEFRPIIDLYVEIENSDGEKVILSWGEIYYPNFLHNSIIATNVARIVPSKTKDVWPLPAKGKLVVANDLITERNIPEPVKITVKSFDRSIPVNRDITPLYSDDVKIYDREKMVERILTSSKKFQNETVHTVFYGRGRGIHSTQPFSGNYLKELLAQHFTFNSGNLKTGMVVLVGKDGYRSVYSYSEIVNRNDQAEVLLVPCEQEKDGGKFRIFPSCDFFSDRAVKALSEIRYMQ
jgi:hypothetical protein